MVEVTTFHELNFISCKYAIDKFDIRFLVRI